MSPRCNSAVEDADLAHSLRFFLSTRLKIISENKGVRGRRGRRQKKEIKGSLTFYFAMVTWEQVSGLICQAVSQDSLNSQLIWKLSPSSIPIMLAPNHRSPQD